MLKRSRVLLVGVFVCAVAAGTFLTPASVCATTGGCLVPSFAVSQYLGSIGSGILSSLSSTPKICRDQCVDLLKGCNQVAEGAFKCAFGAGDSDIAADDEGCRDLSPGSAIRECRSNLDSNRQGFLDFLRGDLESARNACRNAHDSCLADCEGPSEE
jgi:hypothetical protein